MARDWRKTEECKQPEFGLTVRSLRREAGLQQKQLAAMVGISKTALCHFENDGDRCFDEPTRTKLIDVITARLRQTKPPTDVEFTRRTLLQLTVVSSISRLGRSGNEGEAETSQRSTTEWERLLRDGLEKRAQGDHEEAKRFFKLAEHLGVDVPGVAALAIGYQVQEALDLNEHPQVTERLIETGLHRLGGIGLPAPELSPSPDKLERLLCDDMSRRAYAQLAKASGQRFQNLQRFAEASASFRAYENAGEIIDDRDESARTLAECTHQQALLLTLANTTPTNLDSLAWSWVRDPSAFRHAVYLFERSYEARGNDEVGRAFDLRGRLKALHMLETCSSIDARERRKVAAQREAAEQTLASWEKRNPSYEGVRTLLRLAAGRRARERGNEGAAVDEFEATIEPAWRIRSPYVLADAHGRLGEILAARPGDQLLAIDHVAAAYTGWPQMLFSEDRDRLQLRLRQLGATVPKIEKEWSKGSSPSAQLRAMPTFNQERAFQVLRRTLGDK